MTLLFASSALAVGLQAPIQELFLGETTSINAVGELALAGSLVRSASHASSPLTVELGVFDHLEANAGLAVDWSDIRSQVGTVGVRAGDQLGPFSTSIGVAWGSGSAMSQSPWTGSLALGLAVREIELYLSSEAAGDGVSGAAGVAQRVGSLSPLLEASYADDGLAVSTGALWKLDDAFTVGAALMLDTDRHVAWTARVTAELDLLEERGRR